MPEPGVGKTPERDGFGGTRQGPESQDARGGGNFAGIGGNRGGGELLNRLTQSGALPADSFARRGAEPVPTGGLLTSPSQIVAGPVPLTGQLVGGPTPVPLPGQQAVPDPGVAPAPGTAPVPAAAPFDPADASVASQLDKFLASDSPLLAAARTRAKQDANRRGLLNSSIAVQAGEAAALDVALPIASQQAAQIQQGNLQERQIVSSEKISESGIAAQERIAASNIAAFDREKATAAVAALDASYQQVFAAISANTDIPAEAREAYLIHLAALRDSNFSLIEQLYNINLVWPSPSTGGLA